MGRTPQALLRLGRATGLQPMSATSTIAHHPDNTIGWIARSYASEASTSDSAQQPRKGKKAYNPDAWRARMPPQLGKIGDKLRRENPEAFRRMRIILGYYELPEYRGKLETEAPIQHVTINTLQTLRYLDLDLDYKRELLSYRAKTLNEDLHGLLSDPDLALPQPGARKERGQAVLAGFVPASQPSSSKGSSSSSSSSSSGGDNS